MRKVTLDDVRRILIACAGDQDEGGLSGDISDTEFEALGYDSLALLETAARLNQEWGVEIRDGQISELKTPRQLLAAVNGDAEAAA
ncbi:MAG: acyl carrier protein [Pseudonocardiaceae bacterium]